MTNQNNGNTSNTNQKNQSGDQGFGSMDKDKQREAARKGGETSQSNNRSHQNQDSESRQNK